MNYNQAIARSWDEQLLLNLVRLRYRDTPLFLEVTSVSSQYSMTYAATATPSLASGTARSVATGVSASGSTFSKQKSTSRDEALELETGISYYERPTVQYTPIQGQKFVKQMLSPISLEALALLSESGWSVARLLSLCLQEMNGLENAPTAAGPTPEHAPRYEEFAQATRYMRRLQLDGACEWAIEQSNVGVGVLFVLSPESRDRVEVVALKRLLKLDPDCHEFAVSAQRFLGEPDQIAVRTRSLLGVMYFLSQSVEPPMQHRDEGRVTVTLRENDERFDWADVLHGLLCVKSRDSSPDGAFVKVRYRGSWFYIDDADLNSKSTFGLLSFMFYLQAGDVKSIAPMLTLPVGG